MVNVFDVSLPSSLKDLQQLWLGDMFFVLSCTVVTLCSVQAHVDYTTYNYIDRINKIWLINGSAYRPLLAFKTWEINDNLKTRGRHATTTTNSNTP